MLIESKYVISEKKTKQHSAIFKAVNQLRNAERAILEKNLNLKDTKIANLLVNAKHIIKICMVNDKLILTDANSKTLADKFAKEELPLFVSVTSFFEIVGSFVLKNELFLLENIMLNFLEVQKKYLNSKSKICYIRDFSIENLTIDDLNEIARNKKNKQKEMFCLFIKISSFF